MRRLWLASLIVACGARSSLDGAGPPDASGADAPDAAAPPSIPTCTDWRVPSALACPSTPTPTILYTSGDLAQMGPIVVDDTQVYWVESHGSDEPVTLRAMSKCGGEPITLAELGGYGLVAYDLVVRGGHVYWTSTPKGLGRIPTGGGSVEYFGEPTSFVDAFDVDDSTMFCAAEPASANESGLVAYSLGDASTSFLSPSGAASAQFFRVRVDCASVFFTTGTDYVNLRLAAVPKDGGPTRPLPSDSPTGSGLRSPSPIAMDNDALYWVSPKDGFLRVRKDGTDTRVLAPNAVAVVAVDDEWAYWLSFTQGIVRVPKLGGATEVVASSARAASLAVDESAVYWAGDDSPGANGIWIGKVDK